MQLRPNGPLVIFPFPLRDGQAGEAVSLLLGEVLLDINGQPYITGNMRGSARLAPGQLTHQFSGYLASQDDENGIDFFGATGHNFFSLESAFANVPTDAQDPADIQDQFGAVANNVFVQPNIVAIGALDTLDPRSSRDLMGYTAGIFQPTLNDGSFSRTALFESYQTNPLEVQIRTNAETNKIQAFIQYAEVGFPFEETLLRFGDLDIGAFGDMGNTSGQSIFVDDRGFAAIETAAESNSTNLDPITGLNLYLVTSDAGDYPAGTLPAGVNICDCQYLNWGFWGGSIYRQPLMGAAFRDDFHLATWVVGDVQDLATIASMTGSADYSGHVIGSVATASGVRTWTGNFYYGVNFNNPALSSGTITNYDSANYDLGGMTLQGVSQFTTEDRHKFVGAITAPAGTDPSRSGSFTGSFMAGSGDGAAEMGGQLTIGGTDYQSGGIFAAKKVSATLP